MKSTLILAQSATPAAAAPAATPAVAPAEGVAQQGTTQPSSNETPAKQEQAAGWESMLPILLIGVILYFLMIRPQLKQQKAAKARQETLKAGDKIITNAGFHGIVREVKDTTIKLEIAPNLIVKIEKTCVAVNVDKAGNADKAVKAVKADTSDKDTNNYKK